MSDFTTRDGCWEAFIDQKKRADALEAERDEARAALERIGLVTETDVSLFMHQYGDSTLSRYFVERALYELLAQRAARKEK